MDCQSETYRGLHIVVINTFSGKVETAKVFDTYKSSASLEYFISRMSYPKGYLVIAVCKDECTTNLSLKVIEWFKSMGATAIEQLGYRCGYAFIGVVG